MKMEMEMNQMYCKKCHKLLPEGYKYTCCEACRTGQAFGVRKAIKRGTTVLTIVGPIIAAGIFKLKKES